MADLGHTVIGIDVDEAKITLLAAGKATFYDALAGADAIVLVTEWPEFIALDPMRVAGLVRNRAIVDARNVLDSASWRAAGFTFVGMGRP